MLKNISNLGTTLNKSEQQSINGGFNEDCLLITIPCPEGYHRDENCDCVLGLS
ncbi:hypothetical protein [uncultured Tenacibaculum sp.]|uniref:hypothetical protein n=1 Tax=uncultured Tenacibaculum sp. TaxID=174713 RepID=UPI00261907B3|nr:hypothetical protein [uncultured Tenacibaculum sp.]